MRPPARRARRRRARPTTLYERASEAAGRGDLATAREQLTEALRLDENHADAHSLLGFVLGQQRELAAALAHLERAVALRPESAEAHYNLGVALWYSGSKDRALAELRKCVELDPAAGGSQAFLGTALRETGDLAGARVSLQRAIALLPPTAAVYVDLAITYLRAGDLDKGLGQLEAGLNLPGPWQPAPDWDSATAALRKALLASPGRAEAHNVLGLLLGRQGAASGEVAAEFREAIRLQPGFAEAHNNLGLVLIQAGDDPAGIAALREAVRIAAGLRGRPHQPRRGPHPDRRRRGRPGAREGGRAWRRPPSRPCSTWRPPTAASPSGGPAKEIEQLRRAIELAPTFARAHLALGKALLREGKVAEAIEALQEATRLSPENGEARYQLGLALARAGRKDEATSELQKGRELVAADDRSKTASLDLAEGRAALERGDLEQRGGEAPQRDPAPPRLLRGPELTGGGPGKAGGCGRRLRRVPKGPGAEPGGRARETGPRAADEPAKPPPTTPDGWPSSKTTFARSGSRRSSPSSPST